MVPMTMVGVISDTHGLLRPEALDALRGAQQIIHAGDIGSRSILHQLEKIAPVTAVRGNVDGAWASDIPRDTGGGGRGRFDLRTPHFGATGLET